VPITPSTEVTAPEPLGRRYGLLTAAAGPLNLPASRYGGGITYEPVSCGAARVLPHDCPDPDDGLPTKTFDPGDDWVQADPFIVYATLQCGSAGAGDPDAKVRRRLTNGEQGAVERYLGGVLAAAADTVPAPVPAVMSSVIGALEQWLYGDQGYGNVGYIHAAARLASYVHKGTPLTADSAGRLRTRMGTVVVFGDYPDDGSVFITGHTTVWRAEEPAVSPRGQALNTTTNQLYMLAEREYAVAYDCTAGVATFDVEGLS
jgi:hypothetical protein